MSMRIFDGTVYRDMTPEEVEATMKQAAIAAIEEANRPMTIEEVSRLVIAKQVNALDVDDKTALRMKEFYPEWNAGVSCTVGFKVQRKGRLWKCLQAHTSQTGWEPENAASLWTEINETHAGTEEDPIPYNGNMALEIGKYYMQNHEIYICIRNTEIPVYHAMTELIGLYVDVA